MKKAGNLLETILDLGEELLKAGAEVWRTEELLGELFETYCFKKYALSVTSTGIQATVHTWDNRIYTQIRSIKGRHYDLSKLEKLYALVNRVNETPTGVDTIRILPDEVIETPGVSNVEACIGNAVGCTGFAFVMGAKGRALLGAGRKDAHNSRRHSDGLYCGRCHSKADKNSPHKQKIRPLTQPDLL